MISLLLMNINYFFLQHALIDSKKSYVRYISHELRTPLNTAFLGLRLLTDDLKTGTGAKDIERYGILCDVDMCCKASLDILNDLLCFDKLDCGILELHKQEVPILPLLVDAVAMFAGHAKENNITLSFINIGDRKSVV